MREELHQALRRDFKRMTPALPELFNLAYAVCGSFDAAEYAMRSAMMAAFTRKKHLEAGGSLRRQIVRYALKQTAQDSETTWDGLRDTDEALMQAEAPVRRLAALVYGCGLSERQAAALTGFTAAEASARLDKLSARSARVEKLVRQWMKRPNADMPEAANVLRALEAELADDRRRTSGAATLIAYLLLLLIVAALFWLAAVIFAPAL